MVQLQFALHFWVFGALRTTKNLPSASSTNKQSAFELQMLNRLRNIKYQTTILCQFYTVRTANLEILAMILTIFEEIRYNKRYFSLLPVQSDEVITECTFFYEKILFYLALVNGLLWLIALSNWFLMADVSRLLWNCTSRTILKMFECMTS